MNFQQIKFVVALAECGSFTRAAEACRVTQPALSNAVAQLEEELGGKLFTRDKRGVVATELGAALLPEMRALLSARTHLLKTAAEHALRDRKTIRIGVSPLVSADYMAALLSRARRRDAALSIILSEMNQADIPPALAGGRVDFGVGPAGLADAGVQAAEIYSEPLLLLSEERRSGPVEAARLEDLEGRPFLLVQDDCGLAGAVRLLFARRGRRLAEYEGRALGYHILERWAHLGIGITMLPESKIQDLAFARPVLDQDGRPARILFEAAWPRAAVDRPELATVRALFLDDVAAGSAPSLADRPA